jgi:acetyltransferase-like isoleucine patch superfamily enzyme
MLILRVLARVRREWILRRRRFVMARRRSQFIRSCRRQGIQLTLGAGVQFHHPVRVFGAGGKLIVEDGVSFAFDAGAHWLGPVGIEIRSPEAELRIGRGATIMRAVRLVCFKKITIGPQCAIGDGCLVIDSNGHDFSPGGWDKPDPGAPITLGSHVHIGPDATILKGVTIGDETTVSNRSVVAGNLPARSVAMGNPARVLHQYAADKAAPQKPAV